jgi:hypothetical protein
VVGLPELRAGQKVEEMKLARAAIRYFSRPEADIDFQQTTALEEFRYLQYRSLQRFGWHDGPRALATKDVLKIVNMFNDIFFLGVLNVSFAWKDLTDLFQAS